MIKKETEEIFGLKFHISALFGVRLFIHYNTAPVIHHVRNQGRVTLLLPFISFVHCKVHAMGVSGKGRECGEGKVIAPR